MQSEYHELEVTASCPAVRWRIKYALSRVFSFQTFACVLISSAALCLLSDGLSTPLNFGFGALSYHETAKPVELAEENLPTNGITAATTTATTTARPSAGEDEMVIMAIAVAVSASVLLVIAFVVYAMCAPPPEPVTIEDNTLHAPGYHHHTEDSNKHAPAEEDEVVVDPFLAKMQMDSRHRQNEKR